MIGAQKQGFRQIDLTILATVLLISVAGVLAIKSALHDDPQMLGNVRKQGIGIAVGAVAMIWLATQEYETLLKRTARFIYPVCILMLVAVLKLPNHHASHGAARWIGIGGIQVQPSEFAKIILIGTLALYLANNQDSIRSLRTFFGSLLHIGVPVLLIAKQPDLGTSLVLLGIWFGMMVIAGAKPLHLVAFILAGALIFSAMWKFNVLKQYQKNRLQVFLNPDSDPRDTGYHLHQSEIAIGSGGVSGEGYGHGIQSNGGFIPEQHTDFIFTVVGEEEGFVGGAVLFSAYLFLLLRGVVVMATCKDVLGRYIAAGVLAMLTFHVVVNAGMTMGIMPVVGVPMPFFSYGLSSLLVNMCAVGLLLSVAASRHRSMF